MADPLRLRATVADGFTTPLRKLREELKGVAAANPTKDLRKQWEGVRGELSQTAAVLRTGLAPQFGFLQMGALGLGTALGGAGLALTSFAKGTRDLSLFTREFGLNIDKFRAWSQVLGEVGVSQETLKGSLQGFASVAKDIRNKWGQVYADLQAMNLGDLAESIGSSKNFEQAIERAFAGLQKIPDPVRRRRVAQMLFGVDDIGSAIGAIEGDITTKTRQMIARLGKIGPEGEAAARKFVDELNELNVALTRLQTDALGPLLPQLTEFITWSKEPLGTGLRDFANDATNALRQFKDVMDAWNKGNYRDALRMAWDSRVTPESLAEEAKRAPLIAEKEKQLAEARDLRNKLGFFQGPRFEGRRQQLEEEIKRLTEEIKKLRESGATVQQQSFDGTGFGGGMIHKAGLGGGFSGFGGSRPFMGGLGGLPGLGGGSGAPGGTGGSAGGFGGFAGDDGAEGAPAGGGRGQGPDTGFHGTVRGGRDGERPRMSPRLPRPSRPPTFDELAGALRGFRGGSGGAVPETRGRRAPREPTLDDLAGMLRGFRGGGGGAPSEARGRRGVGSLPEGGDPLIGLIRRKEGTAGEKGFDTSLAHGALLPGGKDTTLTDKTFREIYDLQTHMLRHPGNRWNSSAIGVGQFVRSTIFGRRGNPDAPERGSLVSELGIDPDQKFDRETQLRMMDHLIRRRGRSAAGLGNEWEGLAKFSNPREILEAYDRREQMLAERRLRPNEQRAEQPRSLFAQPLPGQGLSRYRDEDLIPPAAERPGDEMMKRAMSAGVLGGGAQKLDATGSVSISFENMPGNFKARTSTEGLFKEVDMRNTRSASAPVMHEEDI